MASSKACCIHTSCSQLLSVQLNKVSSSTVVDLAKREKEGEKRWGLWGICKLNHRGSEWDQKWRGSQHGSRSAGVLHIRALLRLAATPVWSKGVVPLRAHCSKPSPCLPDLPWTQGKKVQVRSAERVQSLSGNNAYKLPRDREIQPQSVKNAGNTDKKESTVKLNVPKRWFWGLS